MFNPLIADPITGENYSSTSGSYERNAYYNQNILQKYYYPYQFDGWRDNKNYGIIYDNIVLYPKKSILKTYTNNSGQRHSNVAFVVDAFQDMKKYMQSLVTKNVVLDAGSIYTSLNVDQSTDDVEAMYLTHVNKIYNIFSPNYLNIENPMVVKNITTFIDYFSNFLKYVTKLVPVNRHTFFKSNLVPDTINGLYISFNKSADPSATYIKANNYVAHPYFNTFLEVAGRYGFMVDRNYPWRIVADLSSPTMKKYYQNYGINSEEEVFQFFYHKSFTADLVSLKNIIISVWNDFVKTRSSTFAVKKNNKCDNFTFETNTLKFIDSRLFDQYFNINWQLRFYLYLRILEEQLNVSQERFDSLHEESCKINKFYNTISALYFINNRINVLNEKKSNIIYESLTTADALSRVMKQSVIQTPRTEIRL